MKIFISYGTDDISLVHTIAKYIQPHAEVFYWDRNKVPGQESWLTIFNWIDQSDIILAVISGNTVERAMSVEQEIRHAKAKNKTIVPLIGPDVPSSELGFLSGITYQRIEHSNPGPALENILPIISAKKQEIESTKAILLFGGIVALLFLAGTEQ